MIYLYSGTPGSGKSLHAAKDIYSHLRFGRPVIANFEICTEAIPKAKGQFVYMDNYEISPYKLTSWSLEYFKDHKFREGAIKLYIDEAQLLFNARSWDAKGRAEWLSFFSQHRKYGFDIILMAQFDRMIDRQIRSLIEYEYKHRKVSNYGVAGKIMAIFSLGKLFVSVKIWYPLNERIGSEFFSAKKRFYSLYDTYRDFAADDPPPN